MSENLSSVSVNENVLEKMITNVFMDMMKEKVNGKTPVAAKDGKVCDGLFDTVDEAVAAAKAAQKRLVSLSLEKREVIIGAVRRVSLENNKAWAQATVEETTFGRVEDKIQENILAATKTPGTEDLVAWAKSGDCGLTLVEYGPYGVIGAITPTTNATGTLIHNTISMIAGGNTVVYNVHPSAVNISIEVIKCLHKAIVDAGGPEGCIGMVRKPTMDTASELMHHKDIKLLAATGGPGVVDAVLRSGKKAIGAGAGNPPVVVDETACIRRAAEDIINGHSINNNIFCISEKEVLAVDEIADTLIKFMAETGKAAILTEEEADLVTKLVVNGKEINRKFVGKNVQVILDAAGVTRFSGNEKLRCAVFEADKTHPLVWIEQLMPVLPVVRVKDVWEGIDLAVEVEQGNRHTAMMHSTNVEHLTAMARVIETTIFVKNGPSYNGIGFGGEGHTTFTIAGPTGEGITSARSFCRQRRCVLKDGFRIV